MYICIYIYNIYMCIYIYIIYIYILFATLSFMYFTTSPSSLYKPVDCLSSLFDNKDNIWMPTSSQISAPSKLPMVTSKQLSVFFFFKGSLLFYNKDFLRFFIIRKSFSGILMCCWANRIALSNISSDIDG